MLLNPKQENPLVYDGRSILLKEEYLNAMHLYCWAPVNVGYVKKYIIGNPEMTDEQIAEAVEKDIKDEIIQLSPNHEKTWDELLETAKNS